MNSEWGDCAGNKGKTQRSLKKVKGEILPQISLMASLTKLIQNWVFVTLDSGFCSGYNSQLPLLCQSE